MREIKFRAWDGAQMIFYPLWSTLHDKEVLVFDKVVDSYVDESDYDNDLTLMQYTGLKDKNGVEIYEGDLVHYDSGFQEPTLEEVVWLPEQVAFTTISERMLDFDGEKIVANGVSFPMSGKVMEVIGNIYENPELLEK